jgi:hypothetical protein
MVAREQGQKPLAGPRASGSRRGDRGLGFLIFALALGERVDRSRRFHQTARAG